MSNLSETQRQAAYRALADADVAAPGPELADFADTVLTEVDAIDLEDEPYPDDRVAEIADQAVPVYTADLILAVSESIDLCVIEPELGPANDGRPTVANIAAAVLYELGSTIASARLQQRQDEEAV